jgi:outer membrane receptor protein involved in Fe transport
LGLRWDRQTYTDPVFDNQFSPRARVLLDIGPDIDLRLTWGRYYQSQAIQQLQVEDGVSIFNPPQRANHWIAGLQYRSQDGYRLRLEAYLKNYDRISPRFENLFDSLALIPETEPDRVRLDPVSARAKGIEATLEYRGDSEVNWWATVTVSRATDLINGVRQKRSWDQLYALQSGISWERGLWEVGLALNLHTGWPITGLTLGYEEEDDEYFPIPGPRNAEQLNTYGSLDFRVSRDFQVKKGQLSAFFEVTNLTNRKNYCCVDYDTVEEAEGSVSLDAVYDNWLPIIPAIGILWEF